MLWVLLALTGAAGAILALLVLLWKLVDVGLAAPRVNAWPYVVAAIVLSIALAVVATLALLTVPQVIS